MKVLVVSYGDDGHKNYFTEVASRAGIETVSFDAGSYPNMTDEVTFGFSEPAGASCILRVGEKASVKPEEVVGVWWRRPRGGKGEATGPYARYSHLEGEVVIRSISDFLPSANWVSDPEATRLACRKPVQLRVAQRLGFKIPETCITNSPESARAFITALRDKGKQVIVKPVGTSFVEVSRKEKGNENLQDQVIFTQIVPHELILEQSEMVKNCPVIFQEAVQKESDVRITVVDDEVFCAEVTLDGCSNPFNVDWRNYDGVRNYKRHDLPNDLKVLCSNFTKAMGLRFGCIDMAYSKKGGYTFFEINPQGQWLPSEMHLGHPVSTALLKALTK